MGKRSSFTRIPKDLYKTIDPRAVPPVLPFLKAERIASFIDPCYGDGHLVGPLCRAGLECRGRSDAFPRSGRQVMDQQAPEVWGRIRQIDGRALAFSDLNGADAIITNPPWARDVLCDLIARFARLAPTWLLFDGGWKHSAAAGVLMTAYCTDFVALPRLQWIPGTANKAADDCGWYRFDAAKDLRRGVRFWAQGELPEGFSDGFIKGQRGAA